MAKLIRWLRNRTKGRPWAYRSLMVPVVAGWIMVVALLMLLDALWEAGRMFGDIMHEHWREVRDQFSGIWRAWKAGAPQ